ncbi:MAG: glucose-6-phosphate isomerase, partial [Proteobacteria bacterium]|nr:glucose-6-phosphate isomerase [Pseudomonadota bacterium]
VIPFRQTIEHCLEDGIGAPGASRDAYDQALDEARKAARRLRKAHDKRTMPLLQLPDETCDLLSLKDIAGLITRQSDRVIVLGMGGSSLGGQTLAALAPRDSKPVLEFADNLDPHSFTELLTALDPLRTSIIAISKSGGTPETMAQLIALLDAYRVRGLKDEVGARFIAISEPGDNPLRALAARWNIPVLDHDPDLGGRFSVLSSVGLLPACIAGIDAAGVRSGARTILHNLLNDDNGPSIDGAAALYALATEKGIQTHVLMPYAGRLERLSAWYRQLLGESLGKEGKGLTPIAALGPLDQHSMLQLFLDGPAGTVTTLIDMPQKGMGARLSPDIIDDDRLAYLAGRTIGDIVTAQANGTADAFVQNGRPLRRITLDRIDARTLGALMMHFMLETILLGTMLGVDPFDQPAVELGKKLTRDYLAGN